MTTTFKITHKEEAITLLKAARVEVAIKRHLPICFAIGVVYSRKYVVPNEDTTCNKHRISYFELKNWIHVSLNGAGYYDDWLCKNSAAYRNLVDSEAKRKAATQGRLAWIDWMISELEAIK